MQGCCRVLNHLLEAGKEEKFVPVVIEVGSGNQDRTADCSSGIGLMRDRARGAGKGCLYIGVIGIQLPVAQIGIHIAVEALTSALAADLNDAWTARSICPESCVHVGEFGSRVLVDVGDLVSLVPGVSQVRAIERHLHGPIGLRPTGGKIADRTAVCRGYQTIEFSLSEPGVHRHTRHEFDQFGGVAALDGQFLNHGAVNGRRAGSVIEGDGGGFGRGDFNISRSGGHGQNDMRHIFVLAEVDRNVRPDPVGKSFGGDRQLIVARMDRREAKESGAVCDRHGFDAGGSVHKGDAGLLDDGSAGISDAATERSTCGLCGYRTRDPTQYDKKGAGEGCDFSHADSSLTAGPSSKKNVLQSGPKNRNKDKQGNS